MKFFWLLVVGILGKVVVTSDIRNKKHQVKPDGIIMPMLDEMWEEYKKLYNKTYKKEEEPLRRDLWETVVLLNCVHNIRADLGLTSYRRGVNSFSDMKSEEFLMYLDGYIKENGTWGKKSKHRPSLGATRLPKSMDWRKKKAVNDPIDQGDCAACWAIVSLAALEAQYKKKTGKLYKLSVQNLIDCGKTDNGVCDGGWIREGFKYVEANGGINTDEDYPYTGKPGNCRFKKSRAIAPCDGHEEIPEGDENAMKRVVGTYGPVSVGINASPESFQNYKNGIYDDPDCSSHHLNHAMLVVGYGNDDGHDYWLIRNSWGKSWGMNGYMKLARNKKNLCGVASRASYPIVN